LSSVAPPKRSKRWAARLGDLRSHGRDHLGSEPLHLALTVIGKPIDERIHADLDDDSLRSR
jgi:hypothetical protein